MKEEDLISYLDGESSPAENEELEAEMLRDPAAFALFQDLCRQKLMLAEHLRGISAGVSASRVRLRWEIAAAGLLFAASIAALWVRPTRVPEASLQVLSGRVRVDGRDATALPLHAPVEIPQDSSAEIALGAGSTLTLLASSRAVLQDPAAVRLERGTARLRLKDGRGECRVATSSGTIVVSGSEFTVELVPGTDKGGAPMESLLALLVSAVMGSAQVDVAGKSLVLAAGESRAVAIDGTVAETLPRLLSVLAQDQEKKDGDEGKEKKNKKKTKKEDGGEKEDGKKKDKKDDDDKEEKGGKDKGKKED